jgi:hypothetical protein
MKPTEPPSSGGHGPKHPPGARYDDGVPHHLPGVHDELHNVDVEHEHIDVNLRAIGVSVGVLGVTVLVSQVAMYVLFGWFEDEARRKDPPQSPLAAPATEQPASTTGSPYFSTGVTGPQLLTDEPTALAKQRAEEAKRLQSYGWVNQAAGVAHVPIDEAKKLIVQRGLPVREGAPAPAFTVRATARGEASGGRTITVALPEPPAGAPAPPAKPGGH